MINALLAPGTAALFPNDFQTGSKYIMGRWTSFPQVSVNFYVKFQLTNVAWILHAMQMLSGRGQIHRSVSTVWSQWASNSLYVVEDKLLSASCSACKQNNLSPSTANHHWCPTQVSTGGYSHIKHTTVSTAIVILVSDKYQATLTLENFNGSISTPSLWILDHFCRRKEAVIDFHFENTLQNIQISLYRTLIKVF